MKVRVCVCEPFKNQTGHVRDFTTSIIYNCIMFTLLNALHPGCRS